MAVDNPRVVDAIGTDRKTGDVRLAISDHLEWEDGRSHLLVLQEKINSYLAFIESGEVLEAYPNAKGKTLGVHVYFKYPPSVEAEEFLSQAAGIVEAAGIRFSWQTSQAKDTISEYRYIFDAIVADPRYQANLDWGQPRAGHPEGTIRAHIAELEANLEARRPKLTEEEAWKLKLLIHTHDTFKPAADPDVAIAHPRSHASLARAFLAEFTGDADLLAMVQHHDEPFALYRQVKSRGAYNQGRFQALLRAIDDWDLFLAFNLIDGCTAGKPREPLRWLFDELADKVQSRFTAADILGEAANTGER